MVTAILTAFSRKLLPTGRYSILPIRDCSRFAREETALGFGVTRLAEGEESCKAAGAADSGWLGISDKPLKTRDVNETQSLSCLFSITYAIGASEIFSVGPFVMLKIGAVSSEKLVRFQLPNWDWKSRPGTIRTGIFITGGAPKGACCLLWIQRSGQIGE